MARTLRFAAALLAIRARAEADNGSNTPAETSPATGEEIDIQGTLPDTGSTVMSGEEARQMPGGLGDPVRAVAALPGFVPIDPATPYFYLRGAPPQNIEYLVDGVRVPLLFHDGVVSSVIQPGLVTSIDVAPSAVPARFGGVAGGVIELDTRPPATQLHGEAAAKLYETSALVESPFADNGTGLAAARIGYPTLVTQIFEQNVDLSYWDYQARGTWKLGTHDQIGVFAFGSHDRSTENDNGTQIDDLTSDFHRVDLRYDHDLGDRGHVRVAATGGWSSMGAADNELADWSYAARVEGELRLAGSVRLRFGAHLDRDRYSVSSSAAGDPASGTAADGVPPAHNLVAFANADVIWQATDDLQLGPGVRIGYLRSRRATASGSFPVAEPTFAARYRIAPGVTSLTTFGIADQLPVLRVGGAPSLAVSEPGFPTADVRLQHTIGGAQGLEVILPAGIVATATGFASSTTGESDLPAQCVTAFTGYECPDQRADASSYGLELSVKRSLTAHLAGLLSYTLSKTTEHFADGTTQRSPYDRRHVLNAVIAYELGDHWRAGVRGVLYTGQPIYPDVQDGHAAGRGDQEPVYYRADLRAERRWSFANGRSLSLVLEIMNATLTRSRSVDACVPPPGGTCNSSSGGRFVLPSVGLEAAF